MSIAFSLSFIPYESSNASNYKYSLIRMKKDLIIVKLRFGEVNNG